MAVNVSSLAQAHVGWTGNMSAHMAATVDWFDMTLFETRGVSFHSRLCRVNCDSMENGSVALRQPQYAFTLASRHEISGCSVQERYSTVPAAACN